MSLRQERKHRHLSLEGPGSPQLSKQGGFLGAEAPVSRVLRTPCLAKAFSHLQVPGRGLEEKEEEDLDARAKAGWLCVVVMNSEAEVPVETAPTYSLGQVAQPHLETGTLRPPLKGAWAWKVRVPAVMPGDMISVPIETLAHEHQSPSLRRAEAKCPQKGPSCSPRGRA